jgi:hypothetical protein
MQMHRQSYRFFWFLFGFLGLLYIASDPRKAISVSPSAPPVRVAQTNTPGGLSETQKASLKKLGIPIAIPTAIPDTFKVSQVIAKSCAPGTPQKGSCREGSSYTILYRNPQNTCLVVNAVGGGVGGGASEFEFSTRTTLLGKVIILFGKTSGSNQTPTAAQLQKLQPNLSSFPAPAKSATGGGSPLYNVVVGDSDYYQNTYKCGKNTSITPLSLEKIVQSFVLIK